MHENGTAVGLLDPAFRTFQLGAIIDTVVLPPFQGQDERTVEPLAPHPPRERAVRALAHAAGCQRPVCLPEDGASCRNPVEDLPFPHLAGRPRI